jgi:hypothetical protein
MSMFPVATLEENSESARAEGRPRRHWCSA